MLKLKRHYLGLLLRERGLALLGIFLSVLTAYSGIALLAVSGWFISAAALAGLSAITAHAFNFFTPGAMVRGLSISRTAGRYGERIFTHEASLRIIAQLRADLFRFIAGQQWTEQQLNRQDTSSRLLQDIQNIESIYQFALVPAVTALAVSIGYLLTVMLVLPDLLTLLVPLLLVICILLPWLYSRRVLTSESELHKQQAELWLRSSALFSCLRTLTLFGQIESRGSTLRDQAKWIDLLEADTLKRQQQVLLITQLCLSAMAFVSFWQGLVAFSAGQLEGAYVFMLLLLTMGAADVLAGTCPALASLALGLGALSRLQEMSSSSQPKQDKREFNMRDGDRVGLCVEQLSYRFPQAQKPVIQALDYQHLGPGWIWLNGPSGCGKSTLLQLLSGQLVQNQGQIRFDGVDDCQVQLMPQRIDILRASLRDNLCLHHPHSDDQLWQALRQVELADWARSLPDGLGTWLGENEWQPSGGECKRLGLARILLQDARVILLDEPMSGIDSNLALAILPRLAELWQDKLVICSSHENTLQDAQAQILRLE